MCIDTMHDSSALKCLGAHVDPSLRTALFNPASELNMEIVKVKDSNEFLWLFCFCMAHLLCSFYVMNLHIFGAGTTTAK